MTRVRWQPRLMPGPQRLLGFPPFESKPPAEVLRRKLGLERLVLLDNNEEFLGAAPAVRAALAPALERVHRYPDGYDLRLRAQLAADLGLDREQIVIGSGSNQVLETLGASFLKPGAECLISRHAYNLYAKVALQCSAAPRFVPERGWTHDLAAMAQLVDERTGMIFIANPNNPTGTRVAHDELATLLAAVPEHVVVVVDEAYAEYGGAETGPGARALLARHPNLAVTRTFSKAYGLAGLRIGYLIGSPELCAVVRRLMQPYTAGTLALLAAEAAYAARDHLAAVVADNAARRAHLAGALRELGLAPLESHTNFVTVELPAAGAAAARALAGRGIFVRDLDMYGLPNHLRVTVGGRDELELFAAALGELAAAGWPLAGREVLAT